MFPPLSQSDWGVWNTCNGFAVMERMFFLMLAWFKN